MICPKCKTDHKTINDEGNLVSRKIDICVICGYIVKSSDSEKFKERCTEMIQRHITSFKRTKNVEYIYKADVYFKALIEEVEEHAN